MQYRSDSAIAWIFPQVNYTADRATANRKNNIIQNVKSRL